MDESKDDIRRRRQKEFDAKEQVGYPDAFKSDAEKLLDCRERIKQLEKENDDLCDRLNLCGG